MKNIILVLVLVAIIGGAIFYIVREKKKGVKCIGCDGNCKKCHSNCKKPMV